MLRHKDRHLNQPKLLEGLWMHWSHRMIKELKIKRTVFYDDIKRIGHCFPLWHYPK